MSMDIVASEGNTTHYSSYKTHLLLLDVYVGRLFVESNSDRLQFLLEQIPLLVTLARVQHHQNQVGRLGHSNHLTTAS